jgi:hypothetical protein
MCLCYTANTLPPPPPPPRDDDDDDDDDDAQGMEDFYDDKLSCLVLGYLRDETNFNGVEELIR